MSEQQSKNWHNFGLDSDLIKTQANHDDCFFVSPKCKAIILWWGPETHTGRRNCADCTTEGDFSSCNIYIQLNKKRKSNLVKLYCSQYPDIKDNNENNSRDILFQSFIVKAYKFRFRMICKVSPQYFIILMFISAK